MSSEKRFNDLRSVLLRRYGEPVGKICLDGGFTCPNRDGTCGMGGCIFCGSEGAGEFSSHGDVGEQVRQYLAQHDAAAEKPLPNRFIAYFQSFSGTYAAPEVLRSRYDAALCDPRIICLDVATRPDCLPPETIHLLASYRSRVDVWVELGLQSADDETARRINRGYPTAVLEDVVPRLASAGLEPIVHLILGLPGENRTHIRRTVALVNRLPVCGVKLHSLYVTEGTGLSMLYRQGAYVPWTLEQYAEELLFVLTHLRPDIVVHRLTGDGPRRGYLAPEWALHKHLVLNTINRRLACQDRRQGDRVSSPPQDSISF